MASTCMGTCSTSSTTSPTTSSTAPSTEVNDLSAWATSLKNAYVKNNFVHGFVSEESQLEELANYIGTEFLNYNRGGLA